jgi:hypothetical protein
MTCGNEPSADNVGGFRSLAFTKPEIEGGKQRKQQVKPPLRLPAKHWGKF